jgi:hypothetical protein
VRIARSIKKKVDRGTPIARFLKGDVAGLYVCKMNSVRPKDRQRCLDCAPICAELRRFFAMPSGHDFAIANVRRSLIEIRTGEIDNKWRGYDLHFDDPEFVMGCNQPGNAEDSDFTNVSFLQSKINISFFDVEIGESKRLYRRFSRWLGRAACRENNSVKSVSKLIGNG